MKRRDFIKAAAPLVATEVRASTSNSSKQSNGSYHFETEPSEPLAPYGQPTRDPKMTFRASGSIYLLAISGGHSGSSLGLAISRDGGDSFAPPKAISPKGDQVSSHGENSPTFSFGPGIKAYALWERRSGYSIETDLMFSISPAFGHAWESPVKVTDKQKPSTNAFSSLGVSRQGEIYSVWLDGRDPTQCPPGTSSVYLAKSSDGGKSFHANIAVVHGACPCCRPIVTFGKNEAVHVAWRHCYPGNFRDMAVATSHDGGKTFGEPVQVANDRWKINGCPHSGASMVVTGGRLWVAWYSDGDGSNPGVRLAWSDDGAQTFSSSIVVSTAVLDANHPDLTIADNGRLLMVFQGREPGQNGGWGPIGAWLIEISPSGTVTQPMLVPGHRRSISYPRVASSTLGRVIVTWTEKNEKGRSQVRLIRGRRIESSS